MWSPRVYKGSPRLGQLPQSVVNQAAASVVSQAEPRVRSLIADERLRIADAGNAALPFIAAGTAGFFATAFWDTRPKLKLVGYAASAAAFGFGLWRGFSVLGGRPAPSPEESGQSLPFVSDTANQMASAVVNEAIPVIEKIVEEERQRASSAVISTLPFIATGGAITVLTIFGVPEDSKGLKVAGFTAATGAFLIGVWRGLQSVAA